MKLVIENGVLKSCILSGREHEADLPETVTKIDDYAFAGNPKGQIRHLVLPGCVENSKNALRWIAENLSTNVHLSLMAQYYPPKGVENLPDKLGGFVTPEEYDEVRTYSQSLGFHRGWEQELSENVVYRPHFENNDSFEQ